MDYERCESDIFGARVLQGGSIVGAEEMLVSRGTNMQVSASVAYGENGYLVVWQDGRGGYDYYDVYGARLWPNGTVIDTDGFVISAASGLQECTALAHGPDRAVLIAYDSFRPLPYGSMRVMGNFWPGPTPVTFLACRAEANGSSVTLPWQVSCDVPATSFLVERAGPAQGQYVALEVEVTRNNGTWFSCVDHDVLPGATYWYKASLLGVNSR